MWQSCMITESLFRSFQHQLGMTSWQKKLGMKNGKGTGPDDIPAEALKEFDEQNIKDHYRFVQYNLQHWLYTNRYKRIDLLFQYPRSQKAQKCSAYGTISLISHVTKLLLKTIQVRIATKIDQEISILKSVFRPKMGTSERNLQS